MKTTILAIAIVLFSCPVFAQQRIIVEKATGNIVDIGDSKLQYDSRFFDNLDYPADTIPAGANLRKYVRDASGAIVLRPKDQLVKGFADEWRGDLVARINASSLSADLKAILLDIVKGSRR